MKAGQSEWVWMEGWMDRRIAKAKTMSPKNFWRHKSEQISSKCSSGFTDVHLTMVDGRAMDSQGLLKLKRTLCSGEL